MTEYAMLRLDEDWRQRHQLPDAYLPVSLPLTAALPPDALLRLLQDHASSWSGWQTLEPIWERLVAYLARNEPEGKVLDLEALSWTLRLGPVDLNGTIITLQRQGHMIAAIAPRSNGQLVAATYRPLDARAVSMLTGLSVWPAANGEVAMRPNNWEYALDQAGLLTAQAYMSEEGVTYVSFWEHGLGIDNDGSRVDPWYAQRAATPREPQYAAAELRAFTRWPDPPRARLSLVDESADTPLMLARLSSMSGEASRHDRARGCLLGGAIGDALGAPIELLALGKIRQRFGPNGIQELAPAYGRTGAITADTQMTMFTAEGVLRAWVRGSLKGICHAPGVIHHAYLRWLLTQGKQPANRNLEVGKDGSLFAIKALHAQRAPGKTSLAALEAAQGFGSPRKATNHSKGCGGVVRSAPIGLFAPDGDDRAFGLAADSAALTHGHPTAYLAAGYLAAVIAALLRGCGLVDALDVADAHLRRHDRRQELTEAVVAARALASRGQPTPEQVETLGAGWTAAEALSIAIFCSLAVDSFVDGVTLAANRSGDSNSTAAIAGNLLGTLYGYSAIPSEWLRKLELRDEIAMLADDLHAAGSGMLSPETVWERYPGW